MKFVIDPRNPNYLLHVEQRGTKMFWTVLRKTNSGPHVREETYLRCPGRGVPAADFDLLQLRSRIRKLLQSALVAPCLKSDDRVAVTEDQQV